MSVCKAKALNAHTLQQPLQPTPTPPTANPDNSTTNTPVCQPRATPDLRGVARIAEQARREADGEAVQQLAGTVTELEEDRRQGEVESYSSGKGPGGTGVAVGGLEPDAEQELP